MLLCVPLLVLLYLRIQQRRRKFAAQYGNLGLVRNAAGGGPGVRRHVPAMIFLTGITLLLISMARPQATVSVPRGGDARVDLAAVLDELGRRECNDVLVEAGPTLAAQFLQQALCDELIVYFAPKVLGPDAKPMFALEPLQRLEDALQFRMLSAELVGADLKVTLAR